MIVEKTVLVEQNHNITNFAIKDKRNRLYRKYAVAAHIVINHFQFVTPFSRVNN